MEGTQFSWVFPMYTGGIHVIKLLFVFYYRSFSAKNLERWRGKYFSTQLKSERHSAHGSRDEA